MRIDVFTILAQLVNFAVLVWLLWRVLFKPVSAMIRRRDERIQDQLQQAELARTEAETEASALREEREQLEDHRAERLASLSTEVAAERDRLFRAARAEADHERARQRARLLAERADMLAQLRVRLATLISKALDTGLRDLAGRSLEEAAVARFEETLATLPQAQRTALTTASAAEAGLTVATAHALDPATHERLRELLHRELATGAGVAFERDPDLLAGIELRANDRVLGWSARHLMNDLGRLFDESLAAEPAMSDHDAEAAEAEEP